MNQQDKIRIAKINLYTSFVVLALKFLGYEFSRSTAIFSDALETLINVLTAGTALWVIHYVSKPKDNDHPYGHGKFEFFSAAFEGGLIIFAALTIIIESIQSLLQGVNLMAIDLGLVFIVGASVINALVSFGLKKVGEKEKSETLLASSAHLMSDVYTTLGVVVGLLFVKVTGIKWIDPVVSLFVAFHLVYEGYKIVRKSISGLTDEMDHRSLEDLARSIHKNVVPGIINIHNLRAIRSGSFHHIDAHVIVPEFWDVAHVHEVTHRFEENVVRDYHFDGEFAFHIDPCKKNYCTLCEVNSCPIRKENFKAQGKFTVEEIIKGVHDIEK